MKEPERVRKLLQGSANLEFWETYNLNEFFNKLASANELLARLENQSEDTSSKADSTVVESQDSAAVTATISLKDSLTQKIKDMNKSDEQQNINAWKKQNPLFARLNPNVSQKGLSGMVRL